MKSTLAVTALTVFALASGFAQAAPEKHVSRFTVELRPRFVPPKATGVSRGTTATFRGVLKRLGDEYYLTFRLSLPRLTGDPTGCHIHLGGADGRIFAFACSSKTRSGGSSGRTQWLARGVVDFVRSEGAYVDVHTRRNPRGELLGRFPPSAFGKEPS